MDKNEKILKDSIDGLKQSTAPDIWPFLVSELDSANEQNKEVLSKSIESLPQHNAPDIWLGVSSGVETKSKNWWKYLGIAASVSLVIMITYLFSLNQTTEKLTYSTEQVESFNTSQDFSNINTDVDDLLLRYIKENCTRLTSTCQDPEFKELLDAYMELDKTKKELNQTLKKSNDKAQVMKYLIKVEKSQTEIGKDMLKKMKSI